MDGAIVLTHPAAGIAQLTINRPQAHNALTLDAMRQFAQAVDHLSQQADLRVAIVTGAGEQAFCSGGDLTELRDYPTELDGCAVSARMGDALLRLEALPVPVIAAVNGYALGGGSEVALACDLRVVDETARLGFVQIRMALTPGWGAGQRLARLVGVPRAMELLLSGEALDAERLMALGLANRRAAAGAALREALAWASHIAQQPPAVVRAIKTLLDAHRDRPYQEALRLERDLFPPLWAAPAHTQAVEAFFARAALKGT